jgi:uncharacterized protein (UPF0303 family)
MNIAEVSICEVAGETPNNKLWLKKKRNNAVSLFKYVVVAIKLDLFS